MAAAAKTAEREAREKEDEWAEWMHMTDIGLFEHPQPDGSDWPSSARGSSSRKTTPYSEGGPPTRVLHTEPLTPCLSDEGFSNDKPPFCGRISGEESGGYEDTEECWLEYLRPSCPDWEKGDEMETPSKRRRRLASTAAGSYEDMDECWSEHLLPDWSKHLAYFASLTGELSSPKSVLPTKRESVERVSAEKSYGNSREQNNSLESLPSQQESGTTPRMEATPSKGKNDELPPLDERQRYAFDQVFQDKRNVFITGVAGTGKSVLLRHIQRELKRQGKAFAVMAPSGVAAHNVGGVTIHSWTGIGVPRTPRDFERMWEETNKQRLRECECWIIDEVSMLSGELFDCLEKMTRTIRLWPGKRREDDGKVRQVHIPDLPAFGGVQLILFGDFLQLPPVEDELSSEVLGYRSWTEKIDDLRPDDLFLNRGMAFEAISWTKCDFVRIRLDKVYRQQDEGMVAALQVLRRGQVDDSVQELVRRCRTGPCHDCNRCCNGGGDALNRNKPTKLFCRNKEVDAANKEELAKLPGRAYFLDAQDRIVPVVMEEPWSTYEPMKYEANKILRSALENCRARPELCLKVGARVMLLRNYHDKELVNGSCGMVLEMRSVRRVLEDLGSAARDLEGCKIGDGAFQKDYERVVGQISILKHMYRELLTKQETKCEEEPHLPYVKFDSGVEEVIFPEEFKTEISKVGSAIRMQVPLTLAWAISIHKSQGLTIDQLVVNVQGDFAYGQVYVGISRARGICGLQIKGFAPGDKTCVLASKKAIAFDLFGTITETWLDAAQREWVKKIARAKKGMEAKERAEDIAPPCHCRFPRKAIVLQSQRDNENKGELFYKCREKRCDFFEWVRPRKLNKNSPPRRPLSKSGKTRKVEDIVSRATIPQSGTVDV
eukprot:CAMPEP_0197433368 /NCGR_PEP_ID=MMETSP1175-20131217/1263_1 /TAXON_ID=1003142 /ORGANISM="Triceratium dubium, Strain CCMP147" /LENGTH=887 /DNA_ID=CAMNT_0042961725 /DNA_START=96 /DNA_END=2759 /DNA_ORIENTATION=+